jgi:hypothetical protein
MSIVTSLSTVFHYTIFPQNPREPTGFSEKPVFCSQEAKGGINNQSLITRFSIRVKWVGGIKYKMNVGWVEA